MIAKAGEKKSAAEWQRYVDTLAPDALVEKAEAANTVAFVAALQEQGYDADEVTAVLRAFGARFKALGQRPPTGGYLDLAWLAEQ